MMQEPAGLIEIILTPDQHLQLLPLVRQQATNRRGLLLVSVAPFFDEGTPRLRLQAVFLTQTAASKVLKIVHENVTPETNI